VVSWPAKLKPGRFDHPVSSLDVFPTALAVGGGDAPQNAKLDGVDLLPHLRGESKASLADRVLFWRTGGGQNFAVRSGTLKLVKVGKNPAELYDLGADVAESTNLADKEPAAVAALQKRLDTWKSELVAPKWDSPQPAKKK
jgi:arylsulfatase A-like enzyme